MTHLINNGRGAITVDDLIKDLQELPEHVRKATVTGLDNTLLNQITAFTMNGRIQDTTLPKDIRVIICNDIIFNAELNGVESYKEDDGNNI